MPQAPGEHLSTVWSPPLQDRRKPISILAEPDFHRTVQKEQRRTERSRRAFLLMIAELKDHDPADRLTVLSLLIQALEGSARETDHIGWYRQGTRLGVIFTDLDATQSGFGAEVVMRRMKDLARVALPANLLDILQFEFHLYPEKWTIDGDLSSVELPLYSGEADVVGRGKAKQVAKRALDIVGSASMLILLSPLLVLIAALVKATSPGPVLFRQERVGIYGRRFTFFKFRSMVNANSEEVHRAYMERFIAGRDGKKASEAVYKITNDKRVTMLGRILRRTSLDELPQLINVLSGEMSLVGPRPPIPYEVDCYQTWHHRRFLEVKPGITGLWQVSGRSKVSFDEMVRLDLEYARTWSIWLDLKILLKTPRVVLMGDGAH